MDYSYIPPPQYPPPKHAPWSDQTFNSEPDDPPRPIVVWVVWLFLSIPLFHVQEFWFVCHVVAQFTLAVTWLALAPRFSASFFVPAGLCFTPLLILGGPIGVMVIGVCLLMFGLPWAILRLFRLLRVDLLQPGPTGELIAADLADRTQFSLRTVAAVCVLAALGCGLWLAAERFHDWREIRWTVAIFVPCQWLMLTGMLGRAAWYWRAAMLLLVPVLIYAWTYPTRLHDELHVWSSLLITLDQLFILAFLRHAGYRLGMPRSEMMDSFEKVNEKLPQSPWD